MHWSLNVLPHMEASLPVVPTNSFSNHGFALLLAVVELFNRSFWQLRKFSIRITPERRSQINADIVGSLAYAEQFQAR